MKTIRMTEAEYLEAVFGCESLGRCLACGEKAYDVEPDARRYICDSCGEWQVYGLEELMAMGRIELTGE